MSRSRITLKTMPHLDWQPIRWIPIGAIVEVCDERGFIRDAMLSSVGGKLHVFGSPFEAQPTHWRWRFEGAEAATADAVANTDAPAGNRSGSSHVVGGNLKRKDRA